MDTRRIAIVASLSVLVLAILGGALFLAVRSRGTPAPVPESAAEPLPGAPPAVTVPFTPEGCATLAAGEGKDRCLDAAATVAADPSICAGIGDPARRGNCVVLAASLQAKKAKNPGVCGSLEERPRVACETGVYEALASGTDCDGLAEPFRASCRDVWLARTVGKLEDCDAVVDATRKGACAARFATPPTPQDTDGDGLSDADERRYGTDPKKADTDGDGLSDGQEILRRGTDALKKDTDGDGFSDGDEIKNGYNPLGPGKLPATTATTTR